VINIVVAAAGDDENDDDAVTSSSRDIDIISSHVSITACH